MKNMLFIVEIFSRRNCTNLNLNGIILSIDKYNRGENMGCQDLEKNDPGKTKVILLLKKEQRRKGLRLREKRREKNLVMEKNHPIEKEFLILMRRKINGRFI